jgi:hypothetical protein
MHKLHSAKERESKNFAIISRNTFFGLYSKPKEARNCSSGSPNISSCLRGVENSFPKEGGPTQLNFTASLSAKDFSFSSGAVRDCCYQKKKLILM